MWKHSLALSVCFAGALLLTGCNLRFTTGFAKDTVARINDTDISIGMYSLLVSEQKLELEEMLDSGVWDEKPDGVMTMADYVSDEALDVLKHITVVNSIAENMGLTLSERDRERVSGATEKYLESAGDELKEICSDEDIEEFYSRLYLAEKTFYAATENVDTEVSSDEARCISVQYIFLSTLKRDEGGNLVSVSASEKITKKEALETALKEINEGKDFLLTADSYSEASQNSLTLTKEQYDEGFTNEAFSLESGEVSDIIETDYGYYIIKCINDNIETDYEERCEDIVYHRRKTAFADTYIEAEAGCEVRYNEELLDDVDIEEIPLGSGMLYEIFYEYFNG